MNKNIVEKSNIKKEELIKKSEPLQNHLIVAGVNNKPEIFYTIEGEGIYVGRPSIFVRLSGCNLTCKGFATPDSPHGCDSFISWSVKNKMSFEEIWEEFFSPSGQNFIKPLRHGAILKLTGGEPLLQWKALNEFVWFLNDKLIETYPEIIKELYFSPNDLQYQIDIETNATIQPPNDWVIWGITFTTSPKLSTNGDPESKSYKPDVIKWHADKWMSTFKFVITCSEDIEEIWRKFVTPFDIPLSRIWFMPACGSRKEHIEKAEVVAEYAKQMHVNFSPRLQLVIWDKALLR